MAKKEKHQDGKKKFKWHETERVLKPATVAPRWASTCRRHTSFSRSRPPKAAVANLSDITVGDRCPKGLAEAGWALSQLPLYIWPRTPHHGLQHWEVSQTYLTQHLHLTSSTSLEELVYLCKEKTQHNAFTSVKQNLNGKAHQWQQARLAQVLVLLSHDQLRWMHQIIRPVKKTGSIIK